MAEVDVVFLFSIYFCHSKGPKGCYKRRSSIGGILGSTIAKPGVGGVRSGVLPFDVVGGCARREVWLVVRTDVLRCILLVSRRL